MSQTAPTKNSTTVTKDNFAFSIEKTVLTTGLVSLMHTTERTTPCFTKKPFDFLLYLCQIVDNFYKNYPVCALENVLSSTIKNFCTYNIHSLQTNI